MGVDEWRYTIRRDGDQIEVQLPNADGKTKTVIKATLGLIDMTVKIGEDGKGEGRC